MNRCFIPCETRGEAMRHMWLIGSKGNEELLLYGQPNSCAELMVQTNKSMAPCYSSVHPGAMYLKNPHDSSDICHCFSDGLYICSIQIYEISHQTCGPSNRKCPMCPMIFMNTADEEEHHTMVFIGSSGWIRACPHVTVFDFNSSPIANAIKIPLGYEILNSCSPHGHWNFCFLDIIDIHGYDEI